MSERGHSYHVDTRQSPLLIEQIVSSDINGVRTEIYRQIVKLRDEVIREALIGLGWTPPEQPVVPQVSDAMVQRALDAKVAEGETVFWPIVFGLNKDSESTRAIMAGEIIRAAIEAALAQPGDILAITAYVEDTSGSGLVMQPGEGE